MRLAITAIASLAIAAPALAQTPAAMTAQARQIITQRLIDPDSLQVRNTRVLTIASPSGQQVQVLCGQYNSKNRMGGYTGFKTFIYEPAELGGVISLDMPRAMDFFSSDGTSDAYQDSSAAIRAGLPAATATARFQRMGSFALVYARPCLS